MTIIIYIFAVFGLSIFLWATYALLFVFTGEEIPEEMNCPVCGYYCLGRGGHGCIDKPKLCGLKKENK